jgi:hypothetical protein
VGGESDEIFIGKYVDANECVCVGGGGGVFFKKNAKKLK